MDTSKRQSESRWPHRLAVAMVCATFPLIWIGGLVTTYDAGMAVDDWPTTRGYNLFLYPWTTWVYGPFDLFIEHGHRLMGALVGMLVIGFAVAALRGDSRRWMRAAAVLAVVFVVLQGVLGGARVLMDARTLAMIHGCVGPAFFAYAVALAVMTSRLWRTTESPVQHDSANSLHRLALFTTVSIFLQLIIGARIRHMPVAADPNHFRIAVFFHLIAAAVVVWQILALAWFILRRHRKQRALFRPAVVLVMLVAIQVCLGVGTWVVKYSWPAWASETFGVGQGYTIQANSMGQAITVTAHVATGSLLLVTAVMLTLRVFRLVSGVPATERSSKKVRR